MRQSEVMPTLRKHPASSLWNYEVSKWSPEQVKEFKFLQTGIREAKKMYPQKNPKKKKVVRLSDGKLYKSIKECAEDNNFSPATISRNIRNKTGKYEIG